MIQKAIMTLAALAGFAVCQAQLPAQAILDRYDLSYTVIDPDSVPTDDVYSWWSEDMKNKWISYGNEPQADKWLQRPEPLGFRGSNFERFYIHIDTVYKVSSTVYKMEARSRCKDEYSDIRGCITIDSVKQYQNDEAALSIQDKFGIIYAHYELDALIKTKPIARILGQSEYDFLLHNDSIYYDAMMIVADGYENNQYTGKWVYLSTGDTLTCNWGDFRIPQSYGLDIGTGLFYPSEDYYDFGWKTYLDMDNHSWLGDPEFQHYQSVFDADENWWKRTQ